jgi:large subunit ribosomal protein L4
MSKVNVYNQKGEVVGEALLPKEIFDVAIKDALIKQVADIQMANQRQVLASTKDRAQVRGGGKKPWRQKGTGRARHGSRRSPLWKGGGITFGPTKERNYEKKISKKMRKLALFMVLSGKAKENVLVVLDSLKLEAAKTKLMAGVIKNLKDNVDILKKKGKILIAIPEKDDLIIRATKNIPNIQMIEARNLNVLDLLSYKFLIMPKDSIKVVKETFLKEK